MTNEPALYLLALDSAAAAGLGHAMYALPR